MEIIELQRQTVLSGKLKDLKYRKFLLEKLRSSIRSNEEKIYKAIYKDFQKSKFDTYSTELALVYHEIKVCLKNLKRWSKPKKVSSGIWNFPARSYTLASPYGHCLIIGAWNYPIQLTLLPLVSAIAAGNVCLIKTSELTPEVSKVISDIIKDSFDPSFIHVVEGDAIFTQKLLSYRFDKIFFTGSTKVGKIVAEAASKFLTPTTLELGGKSPCIVLEDIDLAAKRIVWGKFLNAGQTCIAPDYLLVKDSIYESFLKKLIEQTKIVFGDNPLISENYPRIINTQHIERLKKLINSQKVILGGDIQEGENYFSPTIMRDVSFEDDVMKEEIFGPILPVIKMSDLEEALHFIKSRPRPLAFYLFAKNKRLETKILDQLSFGGACINDVVMHITSPSLPFGGVGDSGIGSYHGEFGFRAFSHTKSIMKKNFLFEAPIKYLPYTKWKLNLIRFLFG